ncbi:MAG TPA: ABC transporter substrate-binding protein, partial [Methanomassiliicoccaceae archaeon]|nr:ABC transporter substrate-binding protein [Methanomassiliicoccaceae archaeon]
AATGEGPAVNAIEAYGEDIVVLCSFAVRTAAQVWVAQGSLIGEKIVVEGKTPQEIADQLKDSKLKAGVIEGSSTERLFKRWLDEFEVSYSTDDSADIRLVYLTGSTLVQFATGDIDLLAGSQPYPSTAIENANGVQIGSSADIGVYSSSVLITTKDVYEKKTDMIKEFVAAVKKSTDYVEDHLEECIDICADTIGWSKTVQAEVFANSEPRVEFNDRIVDIMFAAAKEGVTRETIADACPLDMKEYLEQLYA